jgi:hypothetical protein
MDTQNDAEGLKEFDQLFQTPAAQLGCMCGCTLEELSGSLEQRMLSTDPDYFWRHGTGDEGSATEEGVVSGWKYTDMNPAL